MKKEIIDAIRDEATACLKSSENAGPYAECFHTCFIVLSSLSDRIEKINEDKTPQ